MRAVVYDRYGPPEVLRLVEIPIPSPKDDEILVKVHATTVTIGDCRMRGFSVPAGEWLPARLYLGVLRPRRKTLGMELAGVVEAAGKGVRRFAVGDAVLASTFGSGFGGYAEYKCLRENAGVARKPASLNFGEAAALVGGGVTALRLLRKTGNLAGRTLLVYGASGAVGSCAVQLAKHFGATVTGVCSSRNLELVRSLGADAVIDYTQEDFSLGGERYDVILDAVHKMEPAQRKRAQALADVFLDVHSHAGERDMQADLNTVRDLAEGGHIKPVIDRSYPLERIVEAHRYVEQGHKRGNVVITVAG